MTKLPQSIKVSSMPNSIAVEVDGKMHVVTEDKPHYGFLREATRLLVCYLNEHLERGDD